MPETAHQLALPLETHRNHYLFSDHYLNELLPRQAVWREAEAETRQALETITAKYREVADALPHYNEAAAEREWIRPVLDILGHVYHVQPALPDAAGTPDYAFFGDEAAKSAAAPRLGTPAFWETALAVGDAKRWDRPLDRRIEFTTPPEERARLVEAGITEATETAPMFPIGSPGRENGNLSEEAAPAPQTLDSRFDSPRRIVCHQSLFLAILGC